MRLPQVFFSLYNLFSRVHEFIIMVDDQSIFITKVFGLIRTVGTAEWKIQQYLCARIVTSIAVLPMKPKSSQYEL